MAQRSTHPVETPFNQVQRIYASAVGNGTGELTGHNDDLVSSVRTGVGVHTLVFRHKYPKKKHYTISILGTTVGLVGQYTAWDPAAGTATLQLTDAGVAADAAAADTILIAMDVRNSGFND